MDLSNQLRISLGILIIQCGRCLEIHHGFFFRPADKLGRDRKGTSAAFRECVDLISDGSVTPKDIDLGWRLGYGWNAGPFEVADNAGLDTLVRAGESIRALGEIKFGMRKKCIARIVRG